MGEPLARKQAPRSAYEAKISGPYTVASALIGGGGLGIGIDDFSDTLVSEPRRCALMSRIGVKVDARCDEVFPDQAPAILTVQTTGGDILEEIVMVNRGSAERSSPTPRSRQSSRTTPSECCRMRQRSGYGLRSMTWWQVPI